LVISTIVIVILFATITEMDNRNTIKNPFNVILGMVLFSILIVFLVAIKSNNATDFVNSSLKDKGGHHPHHNGGSRNNNENGDKVSYGGDDRREVYQYRDNPNIMRLANATVGILSKSDLQYNGNGTYIIQTKPYTTSSCGKLCTDEPFYNEPSATYCSGALVSTQLIATAGHCVDPCESMAFIFDFRQMSASSSAKLTISADLVYFCEKIVAVGLDDVNDYGVVQLDRPILDRTPIPIRRQGVAPVGTGLIAIGHPMGLSMKVVDGGQVKENDLILSYFTANLDTYAGNSGSMVVNNQTFEIEGILVSGNEDFEWDYNQRCCTSKDCSAVTGCSSSEQMTRIDILSSFIPKPGSLEISYKAESTNGNSNSNKDVIYHSGHDDVFNLILVNYTLVSQSNVNYTVKLIANYYGPLLVNGDIKNFTGVINHINDQQQVTVTLNKTILRNMEYGQSYKLQILFIDETHGIITTKTHIVNITGCGDNICTYDETCGDCPTECCQNDECSHATVIHSLGGEYRGSTTNATSSIKPTCATSSAPTSDVWFVYVPQQDGQLTLSTCNDETNYDTVIAVYSACSTSNNRKEYSCSDDANDNGATNSSTLCGESGSILTMDVIEGVEYFIQITGATPVLPTLLDHGYFKLTAKFDLPKPVISAGREASSSSVLETSTALLSLCIIYACFTQLHQMRSK